MAHKTLNTSWMMLKKHFNKIEGKNLSLPQAKPTPQLEEQQKVAADNFDWALYCGLHDDLREHGIVEEKKAILHYTKYGKKEGRVTSFSALFKKYGLDKINLPRDFSLTQFAELNDFELMASAKKIEHFLATDEPESIRISELNSVNSQFFLELGLCYEVTEKKEKAYRCYIFSNHFVRNAVAVEHMGNRHLGRGEYKGASALYASSLSLDANRKWAYKNIIECHGHLKNYGQAIYYANEGLKHFPGFNLLGDAFNGAIDKFWMENEQILNALGLCGDREQLVSEMDQVVQVIAHAYRANALLWSDPLTKTLNTKRVLIIGDFVLPQCRRYRIYQKVEQLTAAGFETLAMPWTSSHKHLAEAELCGATPDTENAATAAGKSKIIGKIFDNMDLDEALTLHDIVIFYRVPAFPSVIKLIELAKSLGKLTFYEIDDLMFDPVYPPPMETYGGSVKGDFYFNGLVKGMALYRTAASLCHYGIASTQPLAEKLAQLVESKQCYLHRNGLDSNTPSRSLKTVKSKHHVDIFYGSGTHAHNSDFMVEVLPALDHILGNNENVRLIIVGYLQLPDEFLQKYPDQVILKPFSDLSKYILFLADADINIAVLSKNEINDCKSELKWFEAAALGIPSVVNETRNYLDIIRQGEDGFVVSGTKQWQMALEELIKDSTKRQKIGAAALSRVSQDYSVSTMAENIQHVIESAVNDFYKTRQLQQDALPLANFISEEMELTIAAEVVSEAEMSS